MNGFYVNVTSDQALNVGFTSTSIHAMPAEQELVAQVTMDPPGKCERLNVNVTYRFNVNTRFNINVINVNTRNASWTGVGGASHNTWKM